MRRIVIALLLAASVTTSAFALPTSQQVVKLMKKGVAGVKDYKVDAVLTIKSDKINVTGMPMKVFYKAPDKVHIDATEGFVMLPRDIRLGNPAEDLVRYFDVQVLKTEKMAGKDALTVLLVPKQAANSRGGAFKAWIDAKDGLLLSTAGTSPAGPSIKSGWKYTKINGKYWLPSEIRAEMKIPNRGTDVDPTGPDRPKSHFHRPKLSAGTVTIKFKNYKVNTGIPDSVFKEPRLTATPH